MNLLCISNGHGEDAIATRILTAIRQQNPSVSLKALPISGTGSRYHQANIPTLGQSKTLPSGGFLNRDPQQLARDLEGGLIGLTRSQLSAIKAWARTIPPGSGHILAVGDVVPLLFAYYSALPYSFLGTAKSEYWLRDESGKRSAATLWEHFEGWSGSVYLPWERWLMSQRRCRNCFVRDQFTATHLSQQGLPADYLGNPMMDSLTPSGKLTAEFAAVLERPEEHCKPLTVVLLPGSRQPEAYENWNRIVAAIPSLMQAFPDRTVVLLGAIAPTLSQQSLIASLPADWTASGHSQSVFSHRNAVLILTDAYSDCLHQAEIAIATAGTATEQFVGLGKPAVTLPGNGPQFTKAFATVQAKMLGPSIQMVEDVNAVGSAIASLINNHTRLQLIHRNGKHRMGEAGASDRIAKQILDTMNED